MPSIAEALDGATAELVASSKQPAAELRFEAELLLAHCIGKARSYLRAFSEQAVSDQQQADFFKLVEQRRQGQPIAYLLGEREFWSLPLEVGPGVLIPRSDTELLVELALEKIPTGSQSTALDMGTGSGAIALALASERPHCQVFAVDQSTSALAIASRNIERLELNNVKAILSDWYAALPKQLFPLIVSNPPYLAGSDPHLLQGDLPREPSSALVSGPKGDEDLQQLIAESKAWLEDGGWLMLEHGCEQGQLTRQHFLDNGYQAVKTHQDLAGLDRVTLGQKPNTAL